MLTSSSGERVTCLSTQAAKSGFLIPSAISCLSSLECLYIQSSSLDPVLQVHHLTLENKETVSTCHTLSYNQVTLHEVVLDCLFCPFDAHVFALIHPHGVTFHRILVQPGHIHVQQSVLPRLHVDNGFTTRLAWHPRYYHLILSHGHRTDSYQLEQQDWVVKHVTWPSHSCAWTDEGDHLCLVSQSDCYILSSRDLSLVKQSTWNGSRIRTWTILDCVTWKVAFTTESSVCMRVTHDDDTVPTLVTPPTLHVTPPTLHVTPSNNPTLHVTPTDKDPNDLVYITSRPGPSSLVLPPSPSQETLVSTPATLHLARIKDTRIQLVHSIPLPFLRADRIEYIDSRLFITHTSSRTLFQCLVQGDTLLHKEPISLPHLPLTMLRLESGLLFVLGEPVNKGIVSIKAKQDMHVTLASCLFKQPLDPIMSMLLSIKESLDRIEKRQCMIEEKLLQK